MHALASTSFFRSAIASSPGAGGGQVEPLNLSNPRPNGEHCLIKLDQIRGDDASPDGEMWLNSSPQIGGFPKKISVQHNLLAPLRKGPNIDTFGLTITLVCPDPIYK